MTFDILPAIDLRGGRVVRLQQGDFGRETIYDADATATATAFAAAGALWLHVVDLDGARSGARVQWPHISAMIAALGETVRVEVAGGLRDEATIAAALDSGAHRVVIGTAALRDPVFVGRLIESLGAARIVVALDVRGGRAVGHGWARGATEVDVVDAMDRLADAGVTTFEVTAIERDGLLEGPDLGLYERLVRLDRGAVIASGGIATLGDLRAVRDGGCRGAIIGRALYEGRIRLDDAMTIAIDPS